MRADDALGRRLGGERHEAEATIGARLVMRQVGVRDLLVGEDGA